MAERPEDLVLPLGAVQRIMQDALPEGVVISKEARQTISRSSSVFILYLTSCAMEHANKGNRKTVSVNDIFNAVEDMDFDSFVEKIDESLKEHKYGKPNSKKATTSNKENINVESEEEDGEFYEGDENETEEHKVKKRKLSEPTDGGQLVDEASSGDMQYEESIE